MTGFVSFVGAGPGDPELLTLKALARLEAADVVLYDDLAAGPILDRICSGAQEIDVGKRAGRPSPRQTDVNELLVEHASRGGKVVRLKSGDAGLFGRLEEEIDALRLADIGFEIIPGVSSANAAAAAAGIPLTRRTLSRRVQFITGHGTTGALPHKLNMEALADAEATTVVFMPKRTFPKLAERLVAAGLSPHTPALLAENVGRADQRLTRSSVVELARALAEEMGTAPAMILYGPLLEEA